MPPLSAAANTFSVLYSALDNYGGYPFSGMFDAVKAVYNPDDLEFPSNSALILWGGGDISPSIYGQTPGKHTNSDVGLSSRDILELALAGRAIKMGIPIIGICRGAQMMCSLAGGSLIQDVSGHTANHSIVTEDGNEVTTTSLHHQMMFPWKVEHKLIAWSSPTKSKYYWGETDEKTGTEVPTAFPDEIPVDKREPEIIYFPQVKCLAIQGHPEFINNEKHPFINYCQELVKKYVQST